MVEIPLTNGGVALVDDQDADLVSQFNWHKAKKHGQSYYVIRNQHPQVSMHIAILGKLNGYEIDHEDGDGLNNQRSNLRWSTHQQNMCNLPLNSKNRSGIKGVYWNKRKLRWIARIKVSGRNIFLGSFRFSEDAEKARLEAEMKYHGEFARICL